MLPAEDWLCEGVEPVGIEGKLPESPDELDVDGKLDEELLEDELADGKLLEELLLDDELLGDGKLLEELLDDELLDGKLLDELDDELDDDEGMLGMLCELEDWDVWDD